MNENKGHKGIILPVLLFTLYIFVFLLTEFTANVKCADILGNSVVTYVYAIGIVCTSLGYFSFYISRRFIKDERSRKILLSLLTALYILTTICFMFTDKSGAFLTCAFLSLFLFGYVGAFVHYTVSLLLSGKGISGRVIGISIALATILQFIMQNLVITDIALIVSLAVSAAGLIYLAVKPVRDFMIENSLPYSAKPIMEKKSMLLPIAAVAVMSVIFGLADGIVTQLHASGEINLISYSRLFYAAGALAAGFIADTKGKRLLPLFTLCMLMILSVSALFIGNRATNSIYVGAIYVFGGFYVMYLTLTFIKLAPQTGTPELWAGMGRIVRGIFTGILAALSNSLFEAAGQSGIVIIGICFSVLTLVLFVIGGDLNVSDSKPETVKDRKSEFLRTYPLTPRETDVLEKLIDADITNKEIADTLFLSSRVVERYITSIYEKTGVKTRVALVKLYYNS